MNPIDALWKAITYSIVMDTGVKGPGKLIQRLNPETREALEKLTSDDALKMRYDK